MKFLLRAILCALIPQNAYAACTGLIVNTPVRTIHLGLSNNFSRGQKVRISGIKNMDDNLFYCIWSGPCVHSGDLSLHRQTAIKGDPSVMSGVEIKQNTYETPIPCRIKSFK